MPLLIMAACSFHIIKNCLTLIAFKTSANAITANTFFELQQMLKNAFHQPSCTLSTRGQIFFAEILHNYARMF